MSISFGATPVKHNSFSTAQGNTATGAEEANGKLRQAVALIESVLVAPVSCTNRTITEKQVRAMLSARRRRSHHFDDSLFADPAWDILLELYAAHLAQQRISVSKLSMCAAVPGTTGLRWIAVLEQKDLIQRQPDPLDGRRVFVRLSNAALTALENYFQDLPEACFSV